MQTLEAPPILLTPRDDLHYDVRLDLTSLDEEGQRRWFYKRDHEPGDYVKQIMKVIPAGYQFDQYDHFQQVLTVSKSK